VKVVDEFHAFPTVTAVISYPSPDFLEGAHFMEYRRPRTAAESSGHRTCDFKMATTS
jgi:hypothetical protein